MVRRLPLLLLATVSPSAAVPSAPRPDPLPARAVAQDSVPEGLQLPAGPVSRAWALLDPDVTPATLPADWAALLEDEPFRAPATWVRWSQALQAAVEGDAGARTLLGLLAAAADQPDEAWAHAAALSDHPAWCAALVPRLFPGVPLDAPLGAGGELGRLASGTLLRPIAPPNDPELPLWALAPTQASYGGLRIGEGTLDLVLEVQPAGVEWTLTHTGGPEVRVRTRLPAVRQHDLRTEYLDFIRQEDLRGLRELSLSAEDEEPRVLYGRHLPRELDLPAAPAADAPLPQRLAEEGMLWVVTGEAPDAAAAATALAELLGLPIEVATTDTEAGRRTVVRLSSEAPVRRLQLASLRSSVEARVLGAASKDQR